MKNAVIFLVIIIAVICAVGFRFGDKPEMIEATYTVKKGDTLWSIAERFCPDTMDKREYVWNVQKMNGLPDNEYLLPNAEIKILIEVIRDEQ